MNAARCHGQARAHAVGPQSRAFKPLLSRFFPLLFALLAFGCEPQAPVHVPSPASPVLLRSFSSSPDVILEMACVPTGPELCFDAVDNNCNGALDEGCGVHTGIVQFSIAWTEPRVDVDLVVTDPKGQIARVGESTGLGLRKDRDCPGSGDSCQGQNTENVFLDQQDVPRGTYRVIVRLSRLAGAQPPITVRLGARLGQRSYGTVLELSQIDEEKLLLFDL